jgi:hypothetical protein
MMLFACFYRFMLHMTDERHDLRIQLGSKVMPIVMTLPLTRQHGSPISPRHLYVIESQHSWKAEAPV